MKQWAISNEVNNYKKLLIKSKYGDSMANQYGKDFDVNYIKQSYINKGYTPLFNNYKNAHEKLPCMNSLGYKFLLSYDKLQQDRSPQPFYINNPYTIENIKLFMKINNRNDVLLSEDFSEANSKGLNFICENDHPFTMLWKHYKNGSGCPQCKKYKGEERIEKTLKELNIEFEYYKTYDNLYGISQKRQLSYDFYLPLYNLLIEYQGEQHERIVEYFGGREHFKKQQEHDRLKRNYAKENNIDLLEIWYYDFNNIEQILKEYVKQRHVLF